MKSLLAPRAAIRRAAGFAIAYAALLLACLVWLSVDARLLPNGDPVALKPIKFSLSLAAHFATLAILGVWTRRVDAGDRWFALGAHIQLFAAFVEMAAITLQGARGVPSHFNVGTAFDAAVFTVMGLGVALLTLGFLPMLLGLALHRAGPPMARVAVALGLVGLLIGSSMGVAMVSPTQSQAAVIAEGTRPLMVGSTQVGEATGDTTLPFLGWSLEAGDWRAPHFIGIHALQALPLIAFFLLAAPISGSARALLFAASATLYFALLGWSTLQTVNGRSLFDPTDGEVVVAVAALVLVLAAFALARRRPIGRPT